MIRGLGFFKALAANVMAQAAGLLAPNVAPAEIQTVALIGNWSQGNAPAVNTQATTTRAAGAAGVRHICTSIAFVGSAVAAIAAPLVVNLRDGASGAGAILWTQQFIVPAGASFGLTLNGLSIVGSAATAMTLEFSAAPGVTNFESVSISGYDVI